MPVTDPAFTILLPVHRPPAMLPFAINSVLAQTRQDFELFVICDGTPSETVACAEAYAAKDSRIHVFARPKGEGNGDVYRDQALRQARGSYVCQIGDDDLWFPNHLSELALLLRDVDFGNLSHFEVLADGRVVLLSGDASDPLTRQRMMSENFNFMGPTVWGYRLSAYRSLPVGWSPAPPGFPSDLHMIRKFFAQDGLRFGTRVAVTAVKCAAAHRRDWSLERRAVEVREWAERVADPAGRDAIVQMALGEMNRRAYALQVGHAVLHRQMKTLQARNAELTRSALAAKKHLHRREQRILKLRHRIAGIKRAWSWRLTRPFRRLARALGR
jgi:glycosyltransferase involved in cell wall biosynthesis